MVPNESLMDNHQKELSEELERQGYLIEGHVEYELLSHLASIWKLFP